MKNLLLFLGMIASMFISCSPDEEDANLDVSLPILRINDTIYAPSFAEGTFKPGVYWGGKIGDLSIISEQPGIKIFQSKITDYDNLISWDNSLSAGSYPATVIASNTAGETSKKLLFQIYVGGELTMAYSLYPDDQLINSKRQCEFDSRGEFNFFIPDDTFPSWYIPGWVIWLENNMFIFKKGMDKESIFPEELKCFKVGLSYENDGSAFYSGYWYRSNQPIDGLEGGSIEFKKIIY